jgi:hypothetical protein
VLNALDNIRQSIELLETARKFGHGSEPGSALQQAIAETGHSMRVLEGAGLHPDAVRHLEQAKRAAQRAMRSGWRRSEYLNQAIAAQISARAELTQ